MIDRRKVLTFLLLILLVQAYNSCRTRTLLTKSALVLPSQSPWQRLFDCGDDQSFILMTGMNRRAFDLIVNMMKRDKSVFRSSTVLIKTPLFSSHSLCIVYSE